MQDQWPPAEVPVRSLIHSWLPRGKSTIAVAVTGTEVGRTYATAGLELAYVNGDHVSGGAAWGGAVTCVVDTAKAARTCGSGSSKVSDAVVAFIHRH